MEKKTKPKDEKFIEDVIADVTEDFEKRRKARLFLERQWELNVNFLLGNQYCELGYNGEILESGNEYFWQEKKVFNHIAPLIDSRLAKFAKIKPRVSVRPKSDDDAFIAGANLAEKLVEQAFKRSDMEDIVKRVTSWSETCGTGFYKVVWDNDGGEKIGEKDGEPIYEGDAKIIPVSPFEIFPDDLNTEKLSDCASIIHARVMSADKVREKYGVKVKGKEINVLNLSETRTVGVDDENKKTLKNAVIVIERYEKPTAEYKRGRLITVADDKLLYYGDLPYACGENGSYDYPFVKQNCASVVGRFFGQSLIERMIPVQRAFNAVKNRKHEFINRLSTGVLTVEDGSIDADELAEEGLSPGKILVYRQGSKMPEMLAQNSLPDDFEKEEEKLINEFVIISGVSDVSSSATNANLSSGTALEILIEQDNERMLMASEEIRRAYVDVAKLTIRLYAEFMSSVRTVKITDGQGKTRLLYADRSAVCSDDCYLEGENELLYTNAQKKELILKLYESGILCDDDGNVRQSVKGKMLSLLGYKDLDYKKGVSRLQEEKAQRENELLRKGEVSVEEVDDDVIHVEEHTRYALIEYDELSKEEKQRIFAHVKAHKDRIKENKEKVIEKTGE